MYGADSPSIKLMEPPMIGRCTGIIAVKMPFVHQAGAIACGADDLGDGSVFWQQIGTTHDSGIALGINLQTRETSRITLIVADTGIAAVTARHQ